MSLFPRHADPNRLPSIAATYFDAQRGEPETMLGWMLRKRRAFLNDADHPVPVFSFYCMAPDVDGFEEEPRSSSVILNGKRVARVYWSEGVAERTEIFDPPQEIEPGSIVLMPEAAEGQGT